MGKVTYSMNVSLDGFVDAPGRGPDWVPIDEEVHTWWADEVRGTAAIMNGRRLYDMMAPYWPNAESDPNTNDYTLDFARAWNATPKVVVSRTLREPIGGYRLAAGDPVEELERLKAEHDGEISIGGPTLAAAFIERGLVDVYRLVVHPVVLGAGTPFFPRLERPIGLRLTDTRIFGSGAVYLGYEATGTREEPGRGE
jgi:dihydrofolate reductase